MCRRLPVLAALLAVAACASAEPPEALRGDTSAAYDKCLKGVVGVRPIEHCTAMEIDRQRRALDTTYVGLLAALPPARRRHLVQAQRDWERAMHARCRVFSRRRGSLNSMKAQACILDDLIKRRSELAHEVR